jgi:hypothetical protein
VVFEGEGATEEASLEVEIRCYSNTLLIHYTILL